MFIKSIQAAAYAFYQVFLFYFKYALGAGFVQKRIQFQFNVGPCNHAQVALL